MTQKIPFGIVLAAGEATRMPNKLLLPDLMGGIVLQSAVRFCEARCDTVIIVVPPSSTIMCVLKALGHNGLLDIVQPEPKGVVEALQRCGTLTREKEVLITFGDNLYDPRERVESYGASYRTFDKLRDSVASFAQLDVFNRRLQKWQYREESVVDFPDRFGGWIYLRPTDLQRLDATMHTHQLLNSYASPLKPGLREAFWMDVGTPEAYDRYVSHRYTVLAAIYSHL